MVPNSGNDIDDAVLHRKCNRHIWTLRHPSQNETLSFAVTLKQSVRVEGFISSEEMATIKVDKERKDFFI